VQQLPGRRFFRVVFLLPMMITPVGVGYLFRMLADTNKGPLVPIWNALGLEGFTWANNAWGARTAVMIGDIWQWTPFMFIVLVAALEALPVDPYEAAAVDGATGWQIFRNITLPAIVPVSATLVLIRLIEAFKIIDLPNILTNGGPGTATETMTLYAYRIWRAQDMGGSAALAYILLILVTVVATAYVNFMRSRVAN
jgi:multiple sugar transport system permease protein